MQVLKLRAERQRQELTQVQLSYLSGVPVSEISKIETGRMLPYPKHEERLAAALGIKAPDQLVTQVEV